ncbi:uncharacterized protein DFL_009202 [Arthrobotrys flagrans]|uniref:Uncharacterized protein n=1 Tax=Arthrobotrys flagrans TaxID=97331 RepID=A0A436ZRE8_ARTFL|nr:hypothetical protein DFL_009202 [Arthrobotrys flagrans]
MAAESEIPPQANTPPHPPSRAAGLDPKTTPTPSKPGLTSFLNLLPPPRKPHTPKLNSSRRLRFVMRADAPVDVFSKPETPTKRLVIERKTTAAATIANPSPPQHQGTYDGPYFLRVRRFQGPRKQGIYEKIHEEWIKKALLRQEKDLKWNPETGEPLFEVGGGEE